MVCSWSVVCVGGDGSTRRGAAAKECLAFLRLVVQSLVARLGSGRVNFFVPDTQMSPCRLDHLLPQLDHGSMASLEGVVVAMALEQRLDTATKATPLEHRLRLRRKLRWSSSFHVSPQIHLLCFCSRHGSSSTAAENSMKMFSSSVCSSGGGGCTGSFVRSST